MMALPAKTIEFFFDYGSPYSYIAETQIDALARRTDAVVQRRPFLLGGAHKDTGNQSPVFETCVPKREYGGVTMQRWIARHGIPFQLNPFFPINTLAAMRMAVAAQELGVFDTFHTNVFRAFWVDGKNMGDPEIFGAVLSDAGLDTQALFTKSQEQGVKDTLKKATEEAVSRGVFGAPTFFFGDQMYFGQDHMLFLEADLLAA